MKSWVRAPKGHWNLPSCFSVAAHGERSWLSCVPSFALHVRVHMHLYMPDLEMVAFGFGMVSLSPPFLQTGWLQACYVAQHVCELLDPPASVSEVL